MKRVLLYIENVFEEREEKDECYQAGDAATDESILLIACAYRASKFGVNPRGYTSTKHD